MDAERNRPEAYHNDSSTIESNSRMEELEVIFRHMIKNRMSPSAVAKKVFEAIAEEKFFIFKHPELKSQIQARMEDILKERNPVLPPLDQP